MSLASLDKTIELTRRIHSRDARIGIVGMGYVGLPLALLFSDERFRVTGFDIDPRKVDTLNKGGTYIVRIPAAEIDQAREHGFTATADYARIAEMDVVIICVPTPLDEHHEPDLSYITGTVNSIAPHVHDGQLIILESTTYPGTTEEVVVPLLERATHPACVSRAMHEGPGFYVAFSPEREDPGNDPSLAAIFPRSSVDADPSRAISRQPLYGSIFNRTVPVSSPADCGDDQTS